MTTSSTDTAAESPTRLRWLAAARIADPTFDPPVDSAAAPGPIWQPAPPTVAARATAAALDVPFVEDLAARIPNAVFLERIPIGFARRRRCLAFDDAGDVVRLAITEPDDWPLLDLVARTIRRPVEPLFTTPEQLEAAINRAY